MEFKYPASIYDRPRQLLSTLGSFWNRIYAQRDQVDSYVRAVSQVGQQTLQDTLETIAALSRFTVPIFHRDNWYQLTLLQSQRNDARTSMSRYDDGTAAFDGGSRYDIPRTRDDNAYPVPADLANVNLIVNRFTEPSLTWMQGCDFTLDPLNGAIVFREDPFSDTRFPSQPVYVDGQVVDQEVVLWLFHGEFDWLQAYTQFGYALGEFMRSSLGYRQVLNAVLDGIARGPNRAQVERAFAAITGIPLVIEPVETVEQVTTDNNGRLIITDRNAYHFNMATLPVVAVGDTVHAGDRLTDALTFIELNRGITPDSLQALALGPGMVSACYLGDLVFENKDVPLEVIIDDPSGFTKLKWGLGGFPLDVAAFFDEMHARGVERAQLPTDGIAAGDLLKVFGDACEDIDDSYYRQGTLAHAMDNRTNRVGEPTATNLPTTINPLKFLITNVLRNNCSLVRIKAAGLGTNHLGLHYVRMLRKIIPPQTALLLIIELTAQADHVTVSQVGESLATFTAMNTLSDAVVGLVNDAAPGIRVVSGTCQ